ncbi:formin-like protein 5 [Choloepus didactylus]|uniref:formin-like protein 5 n=1 Tax=Choloepus didactylus TaxID=27675 RepID=UPI00189EF54D|nr:formin-like protein 5 [Choloepus didactylus]
MFQGCGPKSPEIPHQSTHRDKFYKFSASAGQGRTHSPAHSPRLSQIRGHTHPTPGYLATLTEETKYKPTHPCADTAQLRAYTPAPKLAPLREPQPPRALSLPGAEWGVARVCPAASPGRSLSSVLSRPSAPHLRAAPRVSPPPLPGARAGVRVPPPPQGPMCFGGPAAPAPPRPPPPRPGQAGGGADSAQTLAPPAARPALPPADTPPPAQGLRPRGDAASGPARPSAALRGEEPAGMVPQPGRMEVARLPHTRSGAVEERFSDMLMFSK